MGSAAVTSRVALLLVIGKTDQSESRFLHFRLWKKLPTFPVMGKTDCQVRPFLPLVFSNYGDWWQNCIVSDHNCSRHFSLVSPCVKSDTDGEQYVIRFRFTDRICIYFTTSHAKSMSVLRKNAKPFQKNLPYHGRPRKQVLCMLS